MPLDTRRKLSCVEMSAPSTAIVPDFSGNRPMSDLNSVVLPMPLRPMIATVSFFWAVKLMPCNASLWP